MIPEEASVVTVVAIGYRARCSEPGCRNLARAILRYSDRSGRPISNLELCNRHTREAIDRSRSAGLTIYD